MGLRQVMVAFAALLLGAGPAAADDYALNKEGYWTVGRGDAGAEACKASFRVADDTVFLLAGTRGEVTFAVMSKRPMRSGKTGCSPRRRTASTSRPTSATNATSFTWMRI